MNTPILMAYEMKELQKDTFYPFFLTNWTFAGQTPILVDKVWELALRIWLGPNTQFQRQGMMLPGLCDAKNFRLVDCLLAKAPRKSPIIRPHHPKNSEPSSGKRFLPPLQMYSNSQFIDSYY
jgi:hypothetical protein